MTKLSDQDGNIKSEWLSDFGSIVGKGRIADLSRTLNWETPHHPGHTPYMFRLMKMHGDMTMPDGRSGSNDVMTMGTHVGTHIDALGHIGLCGHVHGGRDAVALSSRLGGIKEVGIDQVAPIMCRGIMLDVAAYLGTDCLAPAYEISAQELQATAEKQGVEVREGDCVCVRTGWTKHWDDHTMYTGFKEGSPGPGHEAAKWLAEKKIRVTGADNLVYEKLPSATMPVHIELLFRNGIHIIEVLDLEQLSAEKVYEFMFCALPLKIEGGTASPIRPIAIY